MYVCNDKIHESETGLWVCECGFPNMFGKKHRTKQPFSIGGKAQTEGQQQWYCTVGQKTWVMI